MKQFEGKAELIKTKGGEYYLGIIVDNIISNTYSEYERLRFIHENNLLDEYKKREIRNYNHKFHITLLPSITHDLNSKFLVKALTTNFKFELLGIGTVINGDEQTWFIPVKSIELENLFNLYDMSIPDFHITIAFKNKDIHRVNKTNPNLLTFK